MPKDKICIQNKWRPKYGYNPIEEHSGKGYRFIQFLFFLHFH